MSSSFRGDPHWIVVRYSAACERCGLPILRGQSAFYYPKGKSMYCAAANCGPTEAASFAEAVADEDMMRA